jgi:hypothetical protein
MVVAAFAPIGGIRQGFAPVSLVAPAFNTPTCALVGATLTRCEGIVSKRLGSTYSSGRSKHWLKVKNPKAPAVRRESR